MEQLYEKFRSLDGAPGRLETAATGFRSAKPFCLTVPSCALGLFKQHGIRALKIACSQTAAWHMLGMILLMGGGPEIWGATLESHLLLPEPLARHGFDVVL
jgi:hypothetical protein